MNKHATGRAVHRNSHNTLNTWNTTNSNQLKSDWAPSSGFSPIEKDHDCPKVEKSPCNNSNMKQLVAVKGQIKAARVVLLGDPHCKDISTSLCTRAATEPNVNPVPSAHSISQEVQSYSCFAARGLFVSLASSKHSIFKQGQEIRCAHRKQ